MNLTNIINHKKLIFLTFIFGLLLATQVQARTFRVTSNADEVDATVGDGRCRSASGVCTLRAAIQETNALAGADVILLTVPTTKGVGGIFPATYTMSIAGTDEDAAIDGDLDITDSVTILGKGMNSTTVDGNSIERVFDITSNSATVEFAQMKITGGVTTSSGGGIQNFGTLTLNQVKVDENTATGYGGGIYTYGDITISNSIISGNTAGSGGGISQTYNPLIMSNSSVSGNTATSDCGGMRLSTASATISNSTISGNSSMNGGGICEDFKATITHSTISGNTATRYGGGIYVDAKAALDIYLIASIVAGNSATWGGQDCSNLAGVADVTSNGYNLIGDIDGCDYTSDGTDQTGDSSGAGVLDPMLRSLSNGVHQLMPGSPAMDAIPSWACTVTSDQRNLPRPVDGDSDFVADCDIGAVEMQ